MKLILLILIKKILDFGSDLDYQNYSINFSKNNGSKIKTAMFERVFIKLNFLKQVSSKLNLTEILRKYF